MAKTVFPRSTRDPDTGLHRSRVFNMGTRVVNVPVLKTVALAQRTEFFQFSPNFIASNRIFPLQKLLLSQMRVFCRQVREKKMMIDWKE